MPLVGRHPSSIPPSELQYNSQELAELINWVQDHRKCSAGYCLVKRRVPGSDEKQQVCRFDYPKPLREEAGWGVNSKNRVEFRPQRNSPTVNPFSPPVQVSWRGNNDVGPTTSSDNAI
ncbi:hypothetical protein EV361DRAFT_848298 [Lentinula raphanica]|nr:hypothetical protein EV361DRAFT_848298 [Lentinula raphanica]